MQFKHDGAYLFRIGSGLGEQIPEFLKFGPSVFPDSPESLPARLRELANIGDLTVGQAQGLLERIQRSVDLAIRRHSPHPKPMMPERTFGMVILLSGSR